MSFIDTLKQLPKDFWLLCTATTLFYSATHTLTTMLPIYLLHLNYGEDVSGQMLAMFLIISVITRPWVGKFYEERSPRLLFSIGMLAFVLGNVVMLGFSSSIVALLIARALQGVGFSVFNSTSYSFLAQTVPDHARARGIAIFSNAIKFAMAYAPATGWILASKGWYLPAIGVSLGFVAASFIAMSNVCFKAQERTVACATTCSETGVDDEGERDPEPIKGRLFNAKAVFPGLLIASNSVVFGALIPFVPLLVASKGLQHVEGFHLCYAMALIASRFIGGEASDRHGRRFTIIPGMAVVAISLVLMIYSETTWQFLGSAVLYGLGGGVVQPSIVAMVADRTEKTERGSAMATYTMLADFGQALGMLAMGYFGKHYSFSLGLGVVAVINVLGLMLAVSGPLRQRFWPQQKNA